MPPLQKASQIRSIWLRSSPVSTEAAVVPGAMVELGVVEVAPLPLRRLREPAAGAAARGGGSTPGAFSPPPGPFTPSAAPRATTWLLSSFSSSALMGSPASRSRAMRISSFVIRLPSSGIKAIRSLTSSARSGIGTGWRRWAGDQGSRAWDWTNTNGLDGLAPVWELVQRDSRKCQGLSSATTANLCTSCVVFVGEAPAGPA